MGGHHLSPEQLEQFNQEGFLILPSLFDDAEIQRMRQEADRILELILNSSVALNRPSGRLDWMIGQTGSPLGA